MKRTDIEKILVIGSGPIVIGQACEFDYSGTQALKVLKKEGYKIILVNSNPATIMTDPELAHKTYIEPLTREVLEKVIEKERPDALLPTLGGQTALNLAVELAESGILKKYNVELIGAKLDAIKKGEDRLLFKKTMLDAGLDLPKSGCAYSIEEAIKIMNELGLPLIIRPSFCLGGTGSMIVYTYDEFIEAVSTGLAASMINEVLIEESLLGWKEYELEVMRDNKDNCVIVCSIENLDPLGIHTGDSITVAPAQTLTDREYQEMREQAFKIIRAIGVDTGGSNIQFAVDPKTGRIVVIEMNPRVSRSSALASKATGFPIAKIAALLAVGYTLEEIPNDITKKTPACFEPAIDYCVVKIPRFAFEKFAGTDQTLGTSMKSVGEVMAIGRTFKEALQKGFRGLETGKKGLENVVNTKPDNIEDIETIKQKLRTPTANRLFYVKYALQQKWAIEEIFELSKIDPWFLQQIKEIVEFESELVSAINKTKTLSRDLLLKAKQYGFSDVQLGKMLNISERDVRKLRKKHGVIAGYKLVDTCAAEFESYTPYFYSTYEEDELLPLPGKNKVVILGAGPNRIGQGIEFDYCCVHSAWALQEENYKSIMVNCNPETVSTDYDTSDRLYFEPLTVEDVLNIVEKEKPYGVIVQFGGQTPLNLALPLKSYGVKILGTSPESISDAEDRKKFSKLLNRLHIPQSPSGTVFTYAEALKVVKQIGYPVLVRPSYVLGGRAMRIVYDDKMLEEYINEATQLVDLSISAGAPILIDKFLEDATEIDVDALCDGKDVYIAGIMEHIEYAGIHSGDSACVIPAQNLDKKIINTLRDYTIRLALALNVKGLINIQFAVKDNVVYILEANPRASRTVPFVSKATGIPIAKLAAKIMIGKKLSSLLPADTIKNSPVHLDYVSVKEVVLPFNRFANVDILLGPEMRSTGEVMGIDKDFASAFAKAESAAGATLPTAGTILLSLCDRDKKEILPMLKRLTTAGFKFLATPGTAKFVQQNFDGNIDIKEVAKMGAGRPDVIDVIKNREVALLINTPADKKSDIDGVVLRRTALLNNVPVITTMSATIAATECMTKLKKGSFVVNPIQKYYK